jgi:hypothetical protein
MADQWTLADLDAEQLRLIDETEHELPGNVVLVFAPTRWGTVDETTLDAQGLHPVDLEPDELARLQDVERRVGAVAVAYRLDPVDDAG